MPGAPYTMNQASYDLARLRRNGLIARIPHSNTYRITSDGMTFALVYSRVHDKVLLPLTARDQPIAAPADVRAAWRIVTRHIGGSSPDISTAPSPPPASGARPEPLPGPRPRARNPCSKLKTNVEVFRPQWPR